MKIKQISNMQTAIIKYTLFFFFSMGIVSCNFTEECIYFGELEATIDWSQNPDIEYEIPEDSDMQVFLYPLTGAGVSNMLLAPDTFKTSPYCKVLWIGDYDLFIYNPKDLQIKAGSSSEETSIEVNTEVVGTRSYIRSIHPIYVSNNRLNIAHEEVTRVAVQPELFTQELIFNIEIKNMINTKVSNVVCELKGISTGKTVLGKAVTNGNGIQAFSTIEDPLSPISFIGGFHLLGIHPNIDNDIQITLTFEDGHTTNTILNLNKQLKKFSAKKGTIDIIVETGEYSSDASIVGWEDIEWGELEQ